MSNQCYGVGFLLGFTFRRLAFTLAEVLITLGIIGVVASLTMPSLIQKHKNLILANQTKKFYVTWNQAFQRILADEEVYSLSATSLWGEITGDYAYSMRNPATNNATFWNHLSKYVNLSIATTAGNCRYYIDDIHSRESTSDLYAIYTPDGAVLKYAIFTPPSSKTETQCKTIKSLGGNICTSVGELRVDVNGKKGPNVLGRDVHQFLISDTGMIYPRGGKDWALFVTQTALSSNSNYWKNNNIKNAGQYATGKMIEENWTYNY